MHEKIFDKLCDVLDEMERKEKLTASDMQIIDWATHAKKSMLAVDKMMDEDYPENSYGGMSYRDRESYARGRNAKRDSMGRYAREGRGRSSYSRAGGKEEYLENLYDLMDNAPDDKSRQNIQRMIREME